jgi:hypothetical protein
VDIRAPFLLALGVLIAWLTWNADRSGEMQLHYSSITRAEYPRLFQAALIMRWGLVAFAVACALATALGLPPVSK